eukprot:7789309-Pyramimonas_sp.AAC.1
MWQLAHDPVSKHQMWTHDCRLGVNGGTGILQATNASECWELICARQIAAHGRSVRSRLYSSPIQANLDRWGQPA